MGKLDSLVQRLPQTSFARWLQLAEKVFSSLRHRYIHEGNKRIRQIKNSILGEAQKQEAEYFAFLTGWQNCMAGLGLTLASVIKIFQLKRNKQTTICFQDLDLVLIIFRFCISVLSYMGLCKHPVVIFIK